MVRVLLCDDHELVRRGLVTLLEAAGDLHVVGEAATAEEAVIQAVQQSPDVVVMDVRLPGRSGIEACRDIRALRDDIHVLMLTSFANEEALLSSIMAGATGFFLKSIRGAELTEAIRRVAAGESLLDQSAADRVLARLRGGGTPANEAGDHLTHQERRILALIADGLTNRQIAERLDLSEKTVKNYVSNVLDKLGLRRRTQAASYMVRHRVIPEESVN